MTQQPWGQQRPTSPWPAQRPQAPQQWGAPAPQWNRQAGQPAWPAPAQNPWGQGPFGAPSRVPSPVPPAPQPRRRNPLGMIMLAIGLAIVVALATLIGMVTAGQRTNPNRPSGSYLNETYTAPAPDRTPPEIPRVKTRAEANEAVKDNALYRQPVQVPVRCEAGDPNLATASNAELEKHMNDVVACLMRVWVVPVEAAGYELPRPSVTIYDAPITTRCGKAPTHNAFYCSGDQQVYYATDLVDSMPPELQGKRWTVESVIAHEFGHAVQARTALFAAGVGLENNASSKEEALGISRRIELQADCFAGTFLNSIAQSKNMTDDDLAVIEGMFQGFGDDVQTGDPNYVGDHGTGRNRLAWSRAGLAATQLSSCNTFTAGDDETA